MIKERSPYSVWTRQTHPWGRAHGPIASADDPVDVAVRLPPVLERLLDEADVPTEGIIYCANCDAAISHIDAKREVNGSFDHQFTNPHGFTHHFGCYHYAPGCTISGGAHAADSWFPGFAWHLATCTQCANHMGWWFEHKDENFFGLILSQLSTREET